MDVSLIMKVLGVGIIVAVSCQILSKTGRDDQASFVSIAGILAVLFLLVEEIGSFFNVIKDVFGL